MDYLDRLPDKDASEDDKEGLYFINFMTFLGYYILGIEIPDFVKSVFYDSVLKLKDPDQYTIYEMFKNAPDLDDVILRQMILYILKDK